MGHEYLGIADTNVRAPEPIRGGPGAAAAHARVHWFHRIERDLTPGAAINHAAMRSGCRSASGAMAGDTGDQRQSDQAQRERVPQRAARMPDPAAYVAIIRASRDG